MARHSKYQQNIIRNYYKHKDAIGLQRLGELVTDLYLAEGKKRQQLWKNVEAALAKLEVPQNRIDHLLQQQDPALIAALVEELMGGT